MRTRSTPPNAAKGGPHSRGLLDRFPALRRLGAGGTAQVPFVQQLTATECGVACLTMVLGFFGQERGLEEVRDVCFANRDGMNARALLEGASGFGLRGRAVKADIDDLELLTPGATILHWEFQHYVVFAGVRRGFVHVLDPAVGRRRIPMEEFRRSFTGIALLFEPTDLFRRQGRKRGVYSTIFQLIRESGLLRRIAVISLFLQIFGLGLPVLTGQVIDRVLPRGDLGLLWALLFGLGLLVVFRTLGELVRGHLLMHLRVLLESRLTLGFLDHLVSLPFSFFQLRGAGDLMMRLHSNSTVRERLTSTALSGLLDGLMVVLYLVLLLLGNMRMAAIVLAVGALDVGLYCMGRRRLRELTAQVLKAESKCQGYEVEMLTAMETLKASGCEQRAVGHWSNLFVDKLNMNIARDRHTIRMDASVAAIRMMGPLTVLSVGATEVVGGRLTLGGMLTLCAVAGSFLGPLSNLVHCLFNIESIRPYLDRVADVLEATPEQEEGVGFAPRLQGGVALEAVTFSYGPHAPPVLKEVSVDIPAGTFVAIVGRSGSGKSTLASLVLGLNRPSSGRVTFDGADLRLLDVRSVRQQIGVVNQSFALFGATIRENIALADPSLPLVRIEEAARLACVHDDVAALPLGYRTPLLDQGGSLSGGQRQRIALARALLRKPAILLLDEATSALDAATEREVQASLERLSCTRIVIAHRLSTIKSADLILVMEGGRIVESGTHASLLAARGAYCRLVEAQLAQQVSPPRRSGSLDAVKPVPA